MGIFFKQSTIGIFYHSRLLEITKKRLEQVVAAMRKRQVANLLVSDPYSIYYLTGYMTHPGERLLLALVKEDGSVTLYLNQLFPEYQVNTEIEVSVVTYADGDRVIEQIAQALLPGKSSIDKYWPSHFLLALWEVSEDLQPVNETSVIDNIRGIKDEVEQALMRRASQLNDEAMERLVTLVSQGFTESEMVAQLAQIYRELETEGFSFEPIIAYGANGADPHHHTDHSLPKEGDSVVIDIGCRYEGYCSDMTRTVFYGQPNDVAREVYETVKKAQLAAIEQVRPGVTFASIDQAAREVIEQAGYGQYFTHRTGHFIGQEVHEAGDVSSSNEAIVQVGQVFSIEPGIYLPNQVGVRIEDLVLVTEQGCEVLNQVTKDLRVIAPKE